MNAEHFVITKTPCSECSGLGFTPNAEGIIHLTCVACVGNGSFTRETPLLDVLGRLRFGLGKDDNRDCLIDPRIDRGGEYRYEQD